jgi:hypothetical protein
MQLTQTVKPLATVGRNRLFGTFKYKHTPVPDNPEKIIVTDDWAKKNLVTVQLPYELAVLPGADIANLHRLVAPKFVQLVDAWRDAGALGDIKTWNGSYSARLVRGTKQGTLSAHAWGSAFDINAKWNPLGAEGPAEGEEGSVLRLVEIAQKRGWLWGGFFSRLDFMHFELAVL